MMVCSYLLKLSFFVLCTGSVKLATPNHGSVIAAADSLEVGFVTENGTAVTNTIASGASAVFPQGSNYMAHASKPLYSGHT